MCKSQDINRPPENIGGYRPTTGGICQIPIVYGEDHEGDKGPLPLPFLKSFSTLAILSLALLLPFAIALPWPRHHGVRGCHCSASPRFQVASCFWVVIAQMRVEGSGSLLVLGVALRSLIYIYIYIKEK